MYHCRLLLILFKRLFSSNFLVAWLQTLLGSGRMRAVELLQVVVTSSKDAEDPSIWATVATIRWWRLRLGVQLLKWNIAFCSLRYLKEHLNRLRRPIDPTILNHRDLSYEGSTKQLFWYCLWRYLWLSINFESSSK